MHLIYFALVASAAAAPAASGLRIASSTARLANLAHKKAAAPRRVAVRSEAPMPSGDNEAAISAAPEIPEIPAEPVRQVC